MMDISKLIAITDSYNQSQELSENTILRKIIENVHDGIMVTDSEGKVLLVNPSSAMFIHRTPEELVGNNVRGFLEKGFYSRSTILEAIKTRSPVTKLITVPDGKKVISTSVPILDDNKNILMVVTNTRNQELIDTYVAAIEQERIKSEHYKSVVNYLDTLVAMDKTLVATSNAMNEIISVANIISKTDSTVLLLGETGTGKEVLARYIHRNSNRDKEPFIPVNCAAVPNELMESEFFGYDKGAFSGAHVQGKPGFFEIANKGTLFLDEIGELPLHMQSKLLRVLETGEVQRLGGTSFRRTNVRLIAATNKDLKLMVRNKQLREDLYYRLNVIPISIPPLRDRSDDILSLAENFLNVYNKKYGFNKVLSQRTIRNFLNYKWPGNARELRNLIERLVIITQGDELNFDFSAQEVPVEQAIINTALLEKDSKSELPLKKAVKAFEKQYIDQVLRECNGNITEAADRLGIHRTMVYRKIKTEEKL